MGGELQQILSLDFRLYFLYYLLLNCVDKVEEF